MLYRVKNFILLAIAAFAFVFCSKEEGADVVKGEIEVRVSNETAQLLAGIEIQLFLKSDPLNKLASVVSDGEGKVIFSELDAGLYGVKSVNADWIPAEEKVSLLSGQKAKTILQLSKPFEKLTILNYNVLQGFENNQEKKDRFIAWVKKINPDIILFQELNYFKESTLVAFTEQFGHPYAVMTKESGYPTGISSRFPIRGVDRILQGLTHGYVVASVKDLTLFSIHLSPSSLSDRISEMNIILKREEQLPDDALTLISGDFNSYSQYDKDMYGPNFEADMLARNKNVPVDFTATNAIISAGFSDTQAIFNSPFKRTIPTAKYLTPGIAGARYDYVYINNNLSQYCKSSEIIHDPVTDELSDHYPVLITVSRK